MVTGMAVVEVHYEGGLGQVTMSSLLTWPKPSWHFHSATITASITISSCLNDHQPGKIDWKHNYLNWNTIKSMALTMENTAEMLRQTDIEKKSEVCITDHWEIIDWTNLTFLPSSNTCSPFAL